MPETLAWLLIASCWAAVLLGLPLMAKRVRRKGGGHSVMSPFEDLWHPAAHRAEVVIQAESRRVVGIPSPVDPPATEPSRTASKRTIPA